MIRILWAKAEGLFFWFPLIITFHNYNTSILDNFHKCSFATEFLNTAIYDHIEICFLSPFHKCKLSIWFILQLSFNLLWVLFFVLNCLFNPFIQLLLFNFWWFFCGAIYSTSPYYRNVGSWANIIGNCMKLLIGNLWGSCNS